MCRVLKLARQPYCRWLADPVTSAEYAEVHRANASLYIHRDDPELGYRYLVKAVYSNRIVGQSIDSRMQSRLLANAVNRRGEVAGCVVHSPGAVHFEAGNSFWPLAVTT